MPRIVKVRDIKRAIKKAEQAALEEKPKSMLGPNTNRCIAVKVSGFQDKSNKAFHKITTFSGGGAFVTPGLVTPPGTTFPWTGLTAAAPYPFNNCAEAKAYIEILARRENPHDYRITSFTPQNAINPPCPNCAQWVYGVFGEVVDS